MKSKVEEIQSIKSGADPFGLCETSPRGAAIQKGWGWTATPACAGQAGRRLPRGDGGSAETRRFSRRKEM
ncbi:MAG: hypothetical protein HGA31_03030 [Candidatus Moranbacteria bacterium]|nr:hypothetical protein [Candidatus Moranbacteria bacterium]